MFVPVMFNVICSGDSLRLVTRLDDFIVMFVSLDIRMTYRCVIPSPDTRANMLMVADQSLEDVHAPYTNY